MDDAITDLEWQGPYSYLRNSPVGDEYILDVEESMKPGVYLWTVRLESGDYLINYVGMASRSVRGRLADHLAAFLSGQYWIYEADQFASGSRSVIAYQPSGEVWDFANEYSKYSQKILAQLKVMSLFFVSLQGDRDFLMHIESNIIRKLRENGDELVRDFLDNARVSSALCPRLQRTIRIRAPHRLCGLPEDLTIS